MRVRVSAIIVRDHEILGVDLITIAEMKAMLRHMREEGISVLLTDHNVYDTLPVCDRVYVMHAGKVLVEGSASMIASDPTARQFYLGDDFTLMA